MTILLDGAGKALFVLQNPSSNSIKLITDFNVKDDTFDLSYFVHPSSSNVNVNNVERVTAYLMPIVNLTLLVQQSFYQGFKWRRSHSTNLQSGNIQY